MRILYSLILCLLFWSLPAHAKEPIRVIEGAVTQVSDGDTIQVTDSLGTKVKARLYGIDAPETAKGKKPGQPYGEESFQALRQKVDQQRVRLDVMDIDKYRRLVSVVLIGNRDINYEMLAEGHAWAYRKYLKGPLAKSYINAEERANRSRKGLWQQGGAEPPWDFRKIKNSGSGGW